MLKPWAAIAAECHSPSICVRVHVRVVAQVHEPGQPAHTISSSLLAFIRWLCHRTNSGSLPPDEKQKVYDAVIVAAGIVAVLIANVAYVGESCLSRSPVKDLVCMLHQWLYLNVIHTNSFCTILSFTFKDTLMQTLCHTFSACIYCMPLSATLYM